MQKHHELLMTALRYELNQYNFISRLDDLIIGIEQEYGHKNVLGEIDYYIYDPSNKKFHAREVKTNLTEKAYIKAREQLKRIEAIFIPKYFNYCVNDYNPCIITEIGDTPIFHYI